MEEPKTNKLLEFKPEDYPNVMCCGWIEHMITLGYEFPYKRVNIHFRENDRQDYALTFHLKDARTLQPITNRDTVTIEAPYCPFCGAQIYGR